MIKELISLHSLRGWSYSFGLLALAVILLPVLNIFISEESFLHVPNYVFPLLGKYLCYALVALAIDLIWGYTGILSLGHGVFFSMGGYAMGMYLMRSIGKEGMYKSELPDFMVFLDWKELPWYWYGSDYFSFSLLVILLLPGLFAFVFGYYAFRSRIKGVYFAIITQAMTYALMLLFFRNDTGFGGNNGLTDFKRILGYSLQEPSTKMSLFIITAIVLFLSYILSRYIVKSKLGRVLTAIRDVESRVMFSGYNTLHYKLFIWTLSAFLCGIAGALYVPQVGIINPSEMQPSNSIEMAIWVAVGGRGTLGGAILGAGLINIAKSWFTVAAPDYWLYFLGILFISVTLFLPKGLIGIFDHFSSHKKNRKL
jgi:urea transport system permease protein